MFVASLDLLHWFVSLVEAMDGLDYDRYVVGTVHFTFGSNVTIQKDERV
jgi:hypothetical protein